MGRPLNWGLLRGKNVCITIGSGDGVSLTIGTLLGEHGRGLFTGKFEGNVN
jgi:hypothetical protein